MPGATTEPAPPGPAVGHAPPAAGANGSMPDDTRPFIEVSALLTGLPLLNDRVLIEPMAREYVRRLRGTFGDDFTALLRAYASLLDGAARLVKRSTLTAPYLWLLCMLAVIPSVLFWDDSRVLGACIVLFALSYL